MTKKERLRERVAKLEVQMMHLNEKLDDPSFSAEGKAASAAEFF